MHRALLFLVALALARPVEAQSFALRAGDAIRLFVPTDSAARGTFIIREDGGVSLPIVGRFAVAGRAWNAVETEILTALQREIRDPGITLTPLRQVVVLGAVNRPGSFYLEPTVTLAGAVAAASGAVPEGSARRIRIQRGDSLLAFDAPKGRQIADVPVQSGDRIFVLERSWFARNSNFLITALLSFTGIAVTLARR